MAGFADFPRVSLLSTLSLALERGDIKSTLCGKHADDLTVAIQLQAGTGTTLAGRCANKILNRT